MAPVLSMRTSIWKQIPRVRSSYAILCTFCPPWFSQRVLAIASLELNVTTKDTVFKCLVQYIASRLVTWSRCSTQDDCGSITTSSSRLGGRNRSSLESSSRSMPAACSTLRNSGNKLSPLSGRGVRLMCLKCWREWACCAKAARRASCSLSRCFLYDTSDTRARFAVCEDGPEE